MLVQIQNNFMQLFLIRPSTKIAKTFQLHLTKWQPELKNRKTLLVALPHEVLSLIQNNFMQMFLIRPYTKITQMVPLHWPKGPPELKKIALI